MKKMFDRIRRAKTWQERADIAENKTPGTEFDGLFEQAKLAIEVEPKNAKIAEQIYSRLGRSLAKTFQNGEVQTLHELAFALSVWKKHKPKPNYELAVLFSMSGLFPPGWTKLWVTKFNPKIRRMTRGLRGARDPIAMRDLKENLARLDNTFNENQWESRRRKLQKYANDFNIPLDDSGGRPLKKLRHDLQKKAR